MKRFCNLLMAALVISIHVGAQERQNTLDQYIRYRTTDHNGKEIVGIVIPGKPPATHREPVAIPMRSTVLLDLVPAYDWSFGCSATAAAMAAGYYDNTGYANMYAGPTNYSFAPMDNSSWDTVHIGAEVLSQCPLSATRNTVDGRTIRGHVDDYWIAYNNPGPDPFFVNSWTEHTYSDCTGDYMGTNQASLGNVDGGTTFFYYPDGSPLYNYTGSEPGARDGCHGLLDFYESRGYTVVHNYSQLIQGWNNNTDGYTFEQYKHEIDSGRVVLIHIVGHTMLGFGYDDETNLVYLHDTWDYNSHTMTWGGTYAGYAHNMVTVVKLAPSPDGVVANFSSSARRQLINNTVTFSDLTSGNPASWAWSLSPSTYTFVGGTTASSPNPQVQFTAPGLYAVTLTASNSGDSDSETKTNYIEAVSCSNFPLPVSEDFSEESLPLCWLNVDHIGNGQVWQFNNPGNWEINTTTASNGFAILDSDTYGDGNSQNADLVTPLLDFTGYTSINLRFEHYFRQWSVSSGTLSYSINGGSAWTVVQTWTSNTANAATFDQDMSAQVAGQANVKFKWNYVGAYEYYWAVDDISITGVRPGLWIGTGSSNWNTASNWSGSNVPGSTTNVTIPFISPNWPVYSGNLTVGTNCGNITLNGASQLTVTGSLTVPPGKQVNVNDNAVLNVEGMAE